MIGKDELLVGHHTTHQNMVVVCSNPIKNKYVHVKSLKRQVAATIPTGPSLRVSSQHTLFPMRQAK